MLVMTSCSVCYEKATKKIFYYYDKNGNQHYGSDCPDSFHDLPRMLLYEGQKHHNTSRYGGDISFFTYFDAQGQQYHNGHLLEQFSHSRDAYYNSQGNYCFFQDSFPNKGSAVLEWVDVRGDWHDAKSQWLPDPYSFKTPYEILYERLEQGKVLERLMKFHQIVRQINR
jgi:hypothetical protein